MRTRPRRTTREQATVLLILILGGVALIVLGVLFKPVEVLMAPGGLMAGLGLATALLWFGAWRWR